ncbi:hypothetical protein MMC28_005969 [Mycoblastus sanguinarius]|nr:hypothetical protein [Mycoblastus sanguinarius]
MTSNSLAVQVANYTDSNNLSAGVVKILNDHALLSEAITALSGHTEDFMQWLQQSQIGEVILASGVTFAVVLVLLNGIGFGAAGVGASLSHPSLPAGSPDSRQPEISVLAAAFQSSIYGGLTPAGGVFAKLTSMGMLGTLVPVEVGLAITMAAVVALVIWATGVGP